MTSNLIPLNSPGSPFNSVHTALISSGSSPWFAAWALYKSTEAWLISTPTTLFTYWHSCCETIPASVQVQRHRDRDHDCACASLAQHK